MKPRGGGDDIRQANLLLFGEQCKCARRYRTFSLREIRTWSFDKEPTYEFYIPETFFHKELKSTDSGRSPADFGHMNLSLRLNAEMMRKFIDMKRDIKLIGCLLLIVLALYSCSDGDDVQSPDPPAKATISGTLPVLYIETANREPIVSRDEYLDATYRLDPMGADGIEALGTEVEPLAMQIRGRGHSSWKAPKKPYKIKLGKKTAMMGMPKTNIGPCSNRPKTQWPVCSSARSWASRGPRASGRWKWCSTATT